MDERNTVPGTDKTIKEIMGDNYMRVSKYAYNVSLAIRINKAEQDRLLKTCLELSENFDEEGKFKC